jgi:hypothetical protein
VIDIIKQENPNIIKIAPVKILIKTTLKYNLFLKIVKKAQIKLTQERTQQPTPQ